VSALPFLRGGAPQRLAQGRLWLTAEDVKP